jgi:hypothetical protein
MFVRDDNCVQISTVNADLREPPQSFFRAQAAVNQNFCFFGADQNGVAGRAAAENSKFHLLLFTLMMKNRHEIRR